MELDPLSQMIGAQTAQIAEIIRQLTDLRSETLINRSKNAEWREEIIRRIDLVQAEYRTVKHDYRDFEQAKIALDRRLGKLEVEVRGISDIITTWRAKAAMLMSVAIVIGTIVSMVLKPVVDALVARILGW